MCLDCLFVPRYGSLCCFGCPQVQGAETGGERGSGGRLLQVTEIAQDFDGDAYAPTLGAEWKEATRSSHVSTNGLPFDFVSYVRG